MGGENKGGRGRLHKNGHDECEGLIRYLMTSYKVAAKEKTQGAEKRREGMIKGTDGKNKDVRT